MHPIDRRATPRFRVQFRTALSKLDVQEGVGMLHDLSLAGCGIRTSVPLQRGVPVELRIHVPELDWPLMIDAAQVQWVRGRMAGLAFLRVSHVENRRLAEVVARLLSEADNLFNQIVLH